MSRQMYEHILIPTDGSEFSRNAIMHGTGLAKTVGAKVTGVAVTAPWQSLLMAESTMTVPVEEYNKKAAEHARADLAVISETARTAGVECETIHVVGDFPYQEIIEIAKSKHCDLIVMASHGRRGVAAMLLGSEAQKVVTHSHLPVLVCR